ncbi:MAG: hypothetical protein PHI11_08770 [Gallionella sp.]|nr:hypothetical protein [Gallionella sp.]
MARTADYTIQGFLYQFNKTLVELLKAPYDSTITVEGIIEDVEVMTGDSVKAIQCKYHESNDSYSLSAIYKPLLQMMLNFHTHPNANVDYVLFAHFPDLESISVDKTELQSVLLTTNKDFKTYTSALKDVVDLDAFLKKLKVDVGPKFDTLVEEVCTLLKETGIGAVEVETLVYPNAIHLIATLSIQHDVESRKITKKEFLSKLRKIKTTAISHWTLSLKSRKKLLTERRKQLKSNLAINARLRYFVLHADNLQEFEKQVVMFIDDYLKKYHHKQAHLKTPVFCIDAPDEQIKDIEKRLYQKRVVVNHGYIADNFDENRFFRTPMRQGLEREFHLSLLSWNAHKTVLNKQKSDDLFVLGAGGCGEIDIADVNLEELATDSFDEIKYLIGLSDVYE